MLASLVNPWFVTAAPILQSTQTVVPAAIPFPSVPEDAVVHMEKKWVKEYETYFDKPLMTRSLQKTREIRRALKRIAQRTGKKTALIYAVPSPSQLELILVTPYARPIRKTVNEANRNTLMEVAQEFRMTASDPRQVHNTKYLKSAQQLYRWLVTPLETDLQAQGIDILVFCTGAGLRSVPFSALHDGQQFLVEKYSVALIPAFNLTTTHYTDLRNAPVLAMGASQFQDLTPLPAVPLELSTIVQTQGGQAFLNSQFTLDTLKAERQRQSFQIVHLATHGEFLPGSVSNSFIQLWDDRLKLDQLRQLQLNQPPVDLLVLSACRTALGDQQAELGFAGLAVQAGVRSVLGSLWYVSDTGTLALMTEFYHHLHTQTLKVEALRETQIALLKGSVEIRNGQLFSPAITTPVILPSQLGRQSNVSLSHPYYWAAFTMIGSPW
ncbi:CHAT domain-containing protein [Neosynechococcus sphagnicola]|uniref:CHAT domain-containing protein n=1 Tax=Neosynechococcus sphagnicola TaxID=1501145 RepID=UPI000A98C163|nr:CHAT domain-containing protein [Neosynechococcus sphagnicola]